MNYTEIRRLLLKIFIGFLSLTALVAILSVLSHKFGETQLKVLLTTLSITAGSICAMSCAAYYRFMAVVSVLVVLMTLVIPICTRLGAPAAEAPEAPAHVAQRCDPLPERLVLRQVAGAVFADQAGRRYRVTEIQAEAGAPPKGGPAAPPGNSGITEQPPSVG